jgi:hypothetical protein
MLTELVLKRGEIRVVPPRSSLVRQYNSFMIQENRETRDISRDKPPTQLPPRAQHQPRHDMPRLFWPQQLPTRISIVVPRKRARRHIVDVVLADLALHLGVDHARPHRHARHGELFVRQRERKVVQGCLGGAVERPAGGRRGGGAGGCEYDASLRRAEGRESGFCLYIHTHGLAA